MIGIPGIIQFHFGFRQRHVGGLIIAQPSRFAGRVTRTAEIVDEVDNDVFISHTDLMRTEELSFEPAERQDSVEPTKGKRI